MSTATQEGAAAQCAVGFLLTRARMAWRAGQWGVVYDCRQRIAAVWQEHPRAVPTWATARRVADFLAGDRP